MDRLLAWLSQGGDLLGFVANDTRFAIVIAAAVFAAMAVALKRERPPVRLVMAGLTALGMYTVAQSIQADVNQFGLWAVIIVMFWLTWRIAS